MPFLAGVNHTRFLSGMKYSFLSVLILGAILLPIWLLLTDFALDLFPVGLFTLATGGLLLLVSGCIGPGRFQRSYDLVLHTPEPGASFSSQIPVKAFCIDPSISTATVVINNSEVAEMEFEDGLFTTTIKREEFINETLNKIYLKAGDMKSNENHFTLFEYTEEMEDEEIDELYQSETKEPDISLEEAKAKYLETRGTHIGSVALGIFAAGIVVIALGILYDFFFIVLANR